MASYKTVAVPFAIEMDAKNGAAGPALTYEKILNEYAAQGWKFKSETTATLIHKKGCIAGLIDFFLTFLGQKSTHQTTSYKYFIFIKE